MMIPKLSYVVISLFVLYVASMGTTAVVEETTDETSILTTFRFVPGKRGFGDPMPFYWKGEYHVFYLTNPTGNYDVTWEHIVSTDLVNWKELPTALSVEQNDPRGADGLCIFTGDIEEKDGVFHAWYTSWNPLNPEGRELLSHATSRDLIHWTKHPEHRFAPDGVQYANHSERDFRDPEIIWNAEEEKYWMLVFANVPNQWWGRIGLLKSDDLINWTQHAPIEGIPGDETPSYLKFGDTHYIISNDYGYAYAKSMGGPYIRPKLWNSIPVREFDMAGQAAKTVWDGKRYLWFGGWSGRSMPTPREVYAGPDGLLYMKPANEVISYFSETARDLANEPLNTVINVPFAYMLDCQFKMDPASQLTISCGGEYNIGLRPSQAQLTVSAPGNDAVDRPVPVDTSQPVKIQMLVDETLIECFINDQFAQSVKVDRWWPMETTVEFKTEGGRIDVQNCLLRVPE